MKPRHLFSLLALAASIAGAPTAHAYTFQWVGFDDYDALNATLIKSRMAVTYATTRDRHNNLVQQTNPSSALPVDFNLDNIGYENYWLYQQLAWDNNYPYYINVDEPVFHHYHLGFEDTRLYQCTVIPNDGLGLGAGRLVNGNCVAPDWAAEPRYLTSHRGDAVIVVDVFDAYYGNWVPFDFGQFANFPSNSAAIETYYLDSNFDYWVGWAYDPEPYPIDVYLGDIYEIDFTTSGANPFSMDNMWLQVPTQFE
jgi:hypothetical protein